MKKIKIAFLILLVINICFLYSGCGTKTKETTEFPASFFGVEVAMAPNSVISLSDTISSTITYLGYSDRMLSGDFGSNISPNIDNIIAANPDLVFTAAALSSANTIKLNNAGIKIATVTLPKTLDDLGGYYIGVCSLIGGNITGKSVADTFINDINESFNNIKNFALSHNNSNNTAVIFLEENYVAVPDTFIYNIFSYCGINNLINGTDYSLNNDQLLTLNPNIIICDDNVYKKIINNESLKELNAVKNNMVISTDINLINKLGTGFLDNVYSCLQKIYPDFLINGGNDNV